MITIDLTHSTTNHIQRFVGSLLEHGWRPLQLPENGRLRRNRQLLELRTPTRTLKLRLSIYKTTGSGRNKPDERRVQITTTYRAGMQRLPDYQDVVLGYSFEEDAYVGVDPRRLEFGGDTHNASSFLDRSGLETARTDRIIVNPYPAQILGGIEHQAFFRPERLTEYLFNVDFIHDGLYLGDGIYSEAHRPRGPKREMAVEDSSAFGDVLVLADETRIRSRREPSPKLVAAVEQGDFQAIQQAKLSPEEYEAIRKRCEENGVLGEQHALEYERKRLRKLGKSELADRVTWTSRSSVGEGYDIKSFDANGTDRFIEVKATVGSRNTFEMTYNEWSVAEANGSMYFVYHVKKVRTEKPEIIIIENPVLLDSAKRIQKTALGWRITII